MAFAFIFLIVVLGLLFVFMVSATISGSRPRIMYKCTKCNSKRVYNQRKDGVIPNCDVCGDKTEQMTGEWVVDMLGCATQVRE